MVQRVQFLAIFKQLSNNRRLL